MRGIIKRRYHIILIILAAFVLVTGCKKNEEDDRKVSTNTKAEISHKVKTVATTLRDFQPSVKATGTLMAQRHTELYALVTGQIQKLPVEIGDKVSKGDLLFRIRTIDYRLALQQAEANLSSAMVILKDRKREMERMKNLCKAGSSTQQSCDHAITSYEQAEAALSQALASRDVARQSLEDCTITAPYDGVITERYLEENEYVKNGNKVLEMLDLTTLNAEIELPERYAGEIEPTLPVTISTSSRLEPIKGRVSAVNPKVDQTNRTFLVKVAVDNSNGELQAGLFCSAVFQLQTKKDQIAIPSKALIRDRGKSIVWIVKEGKAYLREVREGGTFDEQVWITDGLKSGDSVIIEGAGGLVDGVVVVEVQ